MKKTVLILLITSAMGRALYAEISAEYKPFEDAIRKNDADTLEALVSVYQNNNLPLPADRTEHFAILVSKNIFHQQAIKPRIFRMSGEALLLGICQCCSFFLTMSKTFQPNDQNLPHDWAALKDPNNALLLAIMSGMMIYGIVFTKSAHDEYHGVVEAQQQEHKTVLRNTTKILKILRKEIAQRYEHKAALRFAAKILKIITLWDPPSAAYKDLDSTLRKAENTYLSKLLDLNTTSA